MRHCWARASTCKCTSISCSSWRWTV